MTIFIQGHRFGYELENVARMFTREVTVTTGAPAPDQKGDYAWLYLRADEPCELGCLVCLSGMSAEKAVALPPDAADKDNELMLAVMFYDALCMLTGARPTWGVITGIRPAKFAGQLLQTTAPDAVEKFLVDRYRVSEKKAKLCVMTAQKSAEVAQLNKENSYSLYVSIPFCPTRCSYCSFVSKSVERDSKLVEPYLDKLCAELAESAAIARQLGLQLETVYIGGGTPTVLTAPQLQKLCDCIAANFPLEQAREYSVEAGRPDTIDEDKLRVLKSAGVTRLSINPQTSNPQVLDAIGRKHSAGDIEDSFALARRVGFDNINADLIAGLPLDNLDSFTRSLDWLLGMRPENITVHALTLKRASALTENRPDACTEASLMVDHALEKLLARGYTPYYMYKQKGTVESLENTGYSLPGFDCLYNVYIMDELHTIIACGAGAVTKLKNQKTGLITRIFNYKYPKEYIEGFEEILARRKGIESFYHEV